MLKVLQKHSILYRKSLKNAAQTLKIDLQLQSALIPCENFDLQDDLGAQETLTNRITCKNQQKSMKEDQFYIYSVNGNWILFDCLTCEYVNNRFILHLVQFERIWNPNLSVHVKMAKLASIPPRWPKQAPNQPKMVMNGCVEVDKF